MSYYTWYELIYTDDMGNLYYGLEKEINKVPDVFVPIGYENENGQFINIIEGKEI